jgi:hypothetical protein
MVTLPILSFDEAQSVGEKVHDHWVRQNGDAPVPRHDLAWGDLVQFVTRQACEHVVARSLNDDDMAR